MEITTRYPLKQYHIFWKHKIRRQKSYMKSCKRTVETDGVKNKI